MGQSASLILAARKNNVEGVKAALDAFYLLAADVNYKNPEDGNSAFYLATSNGNVELMKYLHSRGADPDCKNLRGYTPLMEAAAIGDVESVKYLLTITKDIDDENEDGTTALIEASRNGYVQVITLLLDAGADIEHYDEMWGDTPLLKAAYNCRPMAVRLLVERGANILHQDKKFRDYKAASKGDADVIDAVNVGLRLKEMSKEERKAFDDQEKAAKKGPYAES